MKKAVTMVMFALVALGIGFSVWVIAIELSFFDRLFFQPFSLWIDLKSILRSVVSDYRMAIVILDNLLATVFSLILMVGSIAAANKQKWGLYCVRVALMIIFIYLALGTISTLRMDQQFWKYYIIKGSLMAIKEEWKIIGMLVFNSILLLFFFLPVVKNLFVKQPPIPTESTPSFPPPASAG